MRLKMEDEKMVMQISLKDIVEKNIEFCLNNDVFDKIEYINIVEGEVLAYTQILNDIEIMPVDKFIQKYVGEARNLNERIEGSRGIEEKEVERLSGYNNAIINVLKLVNPIYEYRLE